MNQQDIDREDEEVEVEIFTDSPDFDRPDDQPQDDLSDEHVASDIDAGDTIGEFI